MLSLGCHFLAARCPTGNEVVKQGTGQDDGVIEGCTGEVMECIGAPTVSLPLLLQRPILYSLGASDFAANRKSARGLAESKMIRKFGGSAVRQF